MRVSFRAKLLAIVGAAAVALLMLAVADAVITWQVESRITVLHQRYLPRVELGPKLSSDFVKLTRGLQDAVAARDTDALEATKELERAFVQHLEEARPALDAQDVTALRTGLEDYYQAAYDVSRRMVAGETGAAIVESVHGMQKKQARLKKLLETGTAFNRSTLDGAFASVSSAARSAGRLKLAVTLLCLLLVSILSIVLSQRVLRTVASLTAGFERFGRSDFETPVVVRAKDELGDLADTANRMALSLKALAKERDQGDWLKNGLVGLNEEIRGEREPEEVASQAAAFLSRWLEAAAAAVYLRPPNEEAFERVGGFALPSGRSPGTRYLPSEGLVGQAALSEQLTVINDPPPDYLRIASGLGEAAPRALVFLPLVRAGRVMGVLELAFFKPWSPLAGELLRSIREPLAIALESAQSRRALQSLLVETRRQAEQLEAQEEELRATNEELQAQQEELRQSNQELGVQRGTLEKRNAELVGARRALEREAAELASVSNYKTQFLANMSHELRTPLNSMLLLSDLLGANDAGHLSAKEVQYAKTIHGAGMDLLALINQVLDLAKIESGKQELHLAPLQLGELADYARRTFEPVAQSKKIAFQVTVAEGLPGTLLSDRRRIEQVLTNLLGNALKFTSEGTVALHIGRPGPDTHFSRPELAAGRTLALAVSDTGLGIAQEHRERIFSPFEQVEAESDRRFGGTGLGLAISRELAGLLGGELQLQSEPGLGSVFTLYVPLDPPPTSELPARPRAPERREPSPRPRPSPSEPSPSDAPGPRLLLIEDEPAFADAFASVVRAQGVGCQVASDGATGLRLAREERYSGIVLDVRLPGLDGWEVMEQLKADPKTAGIPVYFVSSLDSRERGLSAGAVGYLTKPALRDDLVRVVESLVPRASARPCRVLVVELGPEAEGWLPDQLQREGFEPQQVGTAEAALEALSTEQFDCAILDPAHPELKGLDLLRVLEERGKRLPSVVVYTQRALTKEEIQRLQTYAEAIVLKEGASSERLLDEVRLFARRLNEGRGAPPRASASGPASSVRLDAKRILIVEDDMRTAFALSATLRAKGAEVRMADTGRAGLELLHQEPGIDAVLMDIMMPEMDGFEAMRRIRQNPAFRTLPIIALTAKAMKGDDRRSMEAGATAYLPKPVDSDLLLQTLDTHLSGARDDVG